MLYAQDFASDGEPLPNCTNKGKIDVDCVVDLYESYIIPLTKEIEVRRRLAVVLPQVTCILGGIFAKEVGRVIAGRDRETREPDALVLANFSSALWMTVFYRYKPMQRLGIRHVH